MCAYLSNNGGGYIYSASAACYGFSFPFLSKTIIHDKELENELAFNGAALSELLLYVNEGVSYELFLS